MKQPIVYYITAHGYGHGVRSCDIIRAVHRADPDIPFVVVSDLPASFLRNRLPGIPLTLRSGAFDIGMVQLDSVRVDVAETLARTRKLCDHWPQLVANEATYLKQTNPGLVVADIPAIPFEAAAAAGVPSVAVGNFSWSWIYEAFVDDPAWKPVIATYERGYAKADLLLRLPFAEPMLAFRNRVDVPLVAEPGKPQRDKLAALTGAPRDRRWVLLSFTTLDWDAVALENVTSLDRYAFFTVRPLEWSGPNLFPVNREDLSFPDVLASVDAVITKPGFGVLSECVVNRKPMAYVDREHFREYPVLEAGLRRYTQHQHIPSESLYRGEVGPALDQLFRNPLPKEELPSDHGATVAQHLLARYRPHSE